MAKFGEIYIERVKDRKFGWRVYQWIPCPCPASPGHGCWALRASMASQRGAELQAQTWEKIYQEERDGTARAHRENL